MQQPETPRGSVVTPEAVPLTLDVAGLGSRAVAMILDGLIQGALAIVVALILVYVFAPLGRVLSSSALGGSVIAAIVVGELFVTMGYFAIFEALWNGRTPGKRAMRIRVVRTDGQPVTIGPVLVRNLLRLVDMLPTSYAIGIVFVLLTPRSQRVGDLAAGTLVIRERPAPPPVPLDLPEGPWWAGQALDTAALSEREYDLVRSFLQRRGGLEAGPRAALAAQLASAVRAHVAGPAFPPGHDEAFLEAVAVSYRARFAPR